MIPRSQRNLFSFGENDNAGTKAGKWRPKIAKMTTPGETAGACAYYKDEEARWAYMNQVEMALH